MNCFAILHVLCQIRSRNIASYATNLCCSTSGPPLSGGDSHFAKEALELRASGTYEVPSQQLTSTRFSVLSTPSTSGRCWTEPGIKDTTFRFDGPCIAFQATRAAVDGAQDGKRLDSACCFRAAIFRRWCRSRSLHRWLGTRFACVSIRELQCC